MDYPDRRPRFQLAFAPAIPAAAVVAEALLLAILATIALMIVIQMAPAMGRALEDLARQIQALMAKLIDKVKEAIQGVEDLIKRNSRAGMKCSAELMAFRQVSQELLGLLAVPRPPDEFSRRRLQKQIVDLFEKWQAALEALLACLEANGVTLI